MKTFTEWLDSSNYSINWSRGTDVALNKAVMEWARECYETEAEVERFAAAVASGDPLDKIAEMVALEREPGESDAALRARIEGAKP